MTTTISPAAIQPSHPRREALGVPDEKARYAIQRDIVIEKINLLLLPLMRKHDIDMWITLDREYNPDPFADEIGGPGAAGLRPDDPLRISAGRSSAISGRRNPNTEPAAHRAQRVAHTADGRWTDRIAQKLPGRGNRPRSCRT